MATSWGEMKEWKPTKRWRPGRTGTASSGKGVECEETGEIGFAKTTFVAKEKIAADLAKECEVSVPGVKLGTLQGEDGTVSVSLAFGAESVDLRQLKEKDPELYSSERVQTAIGKASGLLPFYAWIRAEDLKDEHLVITEAENGDFAVAGIDFSYSMNWNPTPETVEAPNGPPALIQAPDKAIIDSTLRKIEACTDERLTDIVKMLPKDVLADADKPPLISAFQVRRSRIREAIRPKRWLP